MVLLVSSTSRKKSVNCQAPQVSGYIQKTQVCRSVCGESQNTPLWWLILAIWYLTFSQCRYFAVKGTSERGFVRCHQFHFRIWLSVRAGNFGSILCSSCLRQTDLFYERLNNVDHTTLDLHESASPGRHILIKAYNLRDQRTHKSHQSSKSQSLTPFMSLKWINIQWFDKMSPTLDFASYLHFKMLLNKTKKGDHSWKI